MPSPTSHPAPAAAAARSPARNLIDVAASVAVAIMLATVLHTTLFQPFTIPSSSMEPTLATGDYVVVSKFAYGWSRASFPFDPPLFHGRIFGRRPARGDVVVFRLPRDPRQTWVKRVIGLPGDRVQVIGRTVLVNGRPLPTAPAGLVRDHDHPSRTVLQLRETQPDGRTYLTYDDPGPRSDATGVYVVPPDSYFVMGDNRDNSLDSRWPRALGVGLLPAENIVGKADVILASWKPGASLLKPWTWLRLRPDRFWRKLDQSPRNSAKLSTPS